MDRFAVQKLEGNDGEWNRTTDLGLMSPLLYRLSYAVKESATREKP